jgi:hypothetical protein
MSCGPSTGFHARFDRELARFNAALPNSSMAYSAPPVTRNWPGRWTCPSNSSTTSLATCPTSDSLRSMNCSTRMSVILSLLLLGSDACEIGKVLSVTESRVCQIHTKAVMSLRNRLMESPLLWRFPETGAGEACFRSSGCPSLHFGSKNSHVHRNLLWSGFIPRRLKGWTEAQPDKTGGARGRCHDARVA